MSFVSNQGTAPEQPRLDNELDAGQPVATAVTIALQIDDLGKTYANGTVALQAINLRVNEGDFFALLGPNGAGKSTAIGIISSLVNKSTGRVQVFGIDIDQNFSQAKAQLGVVPQEFNFNMFETPWQITVNQAGYYGIERKIAQQRAEQYLTQVGLWEKRNGRARNLSGGMKRRLMIARALVHQPRLLILDEPTAGVDIELRHSMWEFLRHINKAGTTIILTTHYLEEAEYLCRHIGIIDHGRLIENTSMRSLLAKLQVETFVLDLAQPLQNIPPELHDVARLIDERTLEADVDRAHGLNRLYDQLSRAGIHVQSMRNKTNRLEQLFVNLIRRNNKQASNQ